MSLHLRLPNNTTTKYVDISLASEALHDDTAHFTNNVQETQYTVKGRYTVDLFPDNTVHVSTKNKHLKKHGLHNSLVSVFRRLGVESVDEDDNTFSNTTSHQFLGYTCATVFGTDGERTT